VQGTITVEGLRNSLNVSLIYLEAWLKGNGCVPIHNLMEDLATAEIARSQSKKFIWKNIYFLVQQWLKHQAKAVDGTTISRPLVKDILADEVRKIKANVKESAEKIDLAHEVLGKMLFNEHSFGDFMSSVAYPYIVSTSANSKL
jgi:malate synthase